MQASAKAGLEAGREEYSQFLTKVCPRRNGAVFRLPVTATEDAIDIDADSRQKATDERVMWCTPQKRPTVITLMSLELWRPVDSEHQGHRVLNKDLSPVEHEPGATSRISARVALYCEISRWLFAMKELPIEVLDFILNYLFQDTEALKSCSLVCREWSQLVQRHLFNSLVIGKDEDHDVDRCRRLLELVNESQHLAHHFHDVQLFVSFDSPDWLELGRDILPELLSRLPEVRSLKLRSGSVESAFSQLPDNFRLSLRHTLSSPSFEKLDLWGWVFVSSAKNLVDLLQCCRESLISLGLSLISYDDKSEESRQDDNSESPHVQLHKLKEIRFLGAGSFPYYRIFETPNVDAVFWPLHRSNEGICRSTLVLRGFPDFVPRWKFHMHDGFEGVDSPMCDALQASSFTYLRRLSLSIDCHTSSNFAVLAIAYLRRLLPVVQLDSITIECLVNCDGPYGPAIWDRQNWELLCDSLIPLFQAGPAEYIALNFLVERCEDAGDPIGPNDTSDLGDPSPCQTDDTEPQTGEAPVARGRDDDEESDDDWDEDSLHFNYAENVETDTQSVKRQVAETRRMMRSRFEAAGLGEVVQMHTQFLLHEVEW